MLINFFGIQKKTKKTKKHIGYAVIKNRVLKVYKISGLSGKRLYNRKKLPVKKKFFTTKRMAIQYKNKLLKIKKKIIEKRKKKTVKRTKKITKKITKRKNSNRLCRSRTSESECCSDPTCKWTHNRCIHKPRRTYEGPRNYHKFGKSINPAVGTNYTLFQYSTNASTPTVNQLQEIQGLDSYSYPVRNGMENHRFYTQKNNLSGMGF